MPSFAMNKSLEEGIEWLAIVGGGGISEGGRAL